MFLFPIIYICSFLFFLRDLARNKYDGIVRFIVFGLPIYTIALSVSYLYGFSYLNPFLQSLKETAIILTLGLLIYKLNKKIRFHIIDKLMLIFFFYVLIYVFLPLGSYGFFQKVLAFKSLCFFPLVYFTGRMIDPKNINFTEILHYICLLSILAGCVLLFEVSINTHLQTFSGYAAYNSHFFDQDPAGSYGLSWTFEIENGMKRFASFFSTPLEYAAATLISISALTALITDNNNKVHFNRFTIIATASTLFAISFALSRASFASYFIILYTYAVITEQKKVLRIFHYSVLIIIAFFLFVTIKGDFLDFVINTIQFTNASSAGHVLEWLNGIESMIAHPLGIGLGESGRISAFAGLNTGGENQFIIIGVQVGIIALAIYLFVYVKLIAIAAKIIKERKGKVRKLAIFIILIKLGLIIPLFTAEVESYIYISYLLWFLSGLFVAMISEGQPKPMRLLQKTL